MAAEETGARILLVDDDPGVRAVVQTMLASAGYQVTLAGNGREALAILSREQVDCVITDLVMPEQEGIETIKIIRRDYPSLRVIAMSGAFGGDYLRIAGYLGAHSTLPKPIQLDTLLDIVSKTLAGR